MPTVGGRYTGPMTLGGRINYGGLFPAPRFVPTGSIQATPKTIGGAIEGWIAKGLSKAGLSERRAAQYGQRVMAPLTDVTPVGNVTGAEQGANQFRQGLTRGDLRSMALGAGMFGLSVLPVPGAVKRGGQTLGKGMFGQMMRDTSGAIRAWHGSPHDFDKFEWSPRTYGTGEGAQAYGHGLYFAENPEVAKDYAKRLTEGQQWLTFGGKRITTDTGLEQLAPRELAAMKAAKMGGPEKALADIEEVLPYMSSFPQEMHSEAAQLLRKSPDAFRGLKLDDSGKLYEVNINAEPEDFLDWDAPVLRQPKPAVDFMERRAGSVDRYLGQPIAALVKNGQHGASTSAIPNEEWLQAGIPGIRFLDQGSRNALGNLTRNYVVFDDSIIDILNKY